MPIYDYECKKCGHKFELRRSFNDDGSACCPECEGDAERIFSPVPVIFKGSGFYVTDHRRPSPTSPTPPETKSTPAPAESKKVKKVSAGE